MRKPKLHLFVINKKALTACGILLATVITFACFVPQVTAISAVVQKPVCVVLDAGHGGADGGVVGSSGVKESDLNLAITKNLAQVFRANGWDVTETRPTKASTVGGTFNKSADMAARKATIKGAGADYVISIHINKFKGSPRRGVQVFYALTSSAPFAAFLQTALNTALNVPTLGREFEPIFGDFYIAKCVETPSVIVECGFLSSPEDEKLLTDETYRMRLAAEIGAAVAEYHTQKEKTQKASSKVFLRI